MPQIGKTYNYDNGLSSPSALTVDFSANDTTPETNQVVTFTDATAGATTWLWNFGDGELSTLQNPTHAYKYAGTYSVTLFADNGSAGGYLTKTNYITVTLQQVYQTNLQMHNKAPVGASPSNMTLIGANVSQWNDATANAFNRTQGTAANRPTYTEVALTVPDGTVYGCVNYDGTNDSLKNNDALFTRLTGSYEVIVFKTTFPTNSGARSLLCAGAAGGSRYLAFYNHGGFASLQAAGVVLFNGSSVGIGQVATEQNQFCVLSIYWNGTSSTLRLNDNVVLTPGDGIGTSSSQGSTQGNNAAEISPFVGSVMEHIIWASKPSDADIAEYIDKYLASKFGLW